jgi:hypothetical protein
MEFFAIALEIVAALAILLVAAAIAAMLSPMVLVVDSAEGWMRMRWLWALEYERPLPGTEGEAGWRFAGRAIQIRVGKPRKKLEARRGKGRKGASRLASRWLRDSAIRRALWMQVRRLLRGILRAAEIKRRRIRVSPADPASAGMLYGFAQTPWGRWTGIEANFEGGNSVLLEIRFYPHRTIAPIFRFFAGLPYRAMIHQWRSGAAEAPAG